VTGSQRRATAAVVAALIGFVSGVSTAAVRRSVAGEVVAVSAGHAVTRATSDNSLASRRCLRHDDDDDDDGGDDDD